MDMFKVDSLFQEKAYALSYQLGQGILRSNGQYVWETNPIPSHYLTIHCTYISAYKSKNNYFRSNGQLVLETNPIPSYYLIFPQYLEVP